MHVAIYKSMRVVPIGAIRLQVHAHSMRQMEELWGRLSPIALAEEICGGGLGSLSPVIVDLIGI